MQLAGQTFLRLIQCVGLHHFEHYSVFPNSLLELPSARFQVIVEVTPCGQAPVASVRCFDCTIDGARVLFVLHRERLVQPFLGQIPGKRRMVPVEHFLTVPLLKRQIVLDEPLQLKTLVKGGHRQRRV